MDILLDSDHDITIANGDLVLVDGVDAIAQDVEIRLQFFLGEWFLDTRLGIPYFQSILGNKPRLTAILGIFRDAILTTPGVLGVSDLSIDYEGTTRGISVRFTGQTSEGVFEFDKDLII